MDFYRPPTSQGTIDAIGSVYRALRAWKFYPKGHPARRSSINHAHAAMLGILGGNDLRLSCGRTGFSFPDGERIDDPTRLTTSLSYELFVRRVHKVSFLNDLFQEDLLDFLKILSLPLETVQQMGGMDKIMSDHGVRSIWVNEFDLSTLHAKRIEVETRGVIPQSVEESEGEEPEPVIASAPPPSENLTPEQQLQSLLGRISAAMDENIYSMLTRQAITCVESLKSQRDFISIFPLLELLASHAEDQQRTSGMRDFSRFAIEQASTGDEFLRFIFDRMEHPYGLTKTALQIVLQVGGASAAIMAIEKMGSTESISTRKSLAVMLSSLGESAVPALIEMTKDKRWYIVRNICVILGVIASSDAIPGLMACLRHTDLRVCKEAIRALSRIGGKEAEAAIISILRGNDTDLFPQAITSLGGMKSRKALPELMRILTNKDTFLKSLSLKLDVLAAIAMIGDRQVTPRLLEIIKERHLLAGNRWKQLKSSAAQCLGKLGDPRALTVLKEYAASQDELGVACSEAAIMIEKTGSNNAST